MKFIQNIINNSFFSDRYASTLHKIPFSKKIINNDTDAYEKFQKHNYVYNKLWVAKSQGLKCDKMINPPSNKLYPVFIKPIINLDGGNKDCYIINNEEEYRKFENRDDLFWCEFIKGENKEGSTDFIIQNGVILYELTYIIQQEKGTFLQNITKVSNKNQCPENVKKWLLRNLSDFNGAVNLQYIDDKIIECGLRFDNGGNFIQYTDNDAIIKNINNFFESGKWEYLSKEKMDFQDRYLISCINSYPIVYYLPAPFIILICKLINIQSYNFYIDDSKDKVLYLDLIDSDLEKIQKMKYFIQKLMFFINWFFILGLLFFIVFFIFYYFNYFRLITKKSLKKKYYRNMIQYLIIFFIGFVSLYLTRFINPPKYMRRVI